MLSPGKPINQFFYIRSIAGTILTPDAPPIGTLIRGSIDTVVTVSVTTAIDGGWIASATIPTNWLEGDSVAIRLSSNVGGIPVSQTIKTGTVGIDSQGIRNALAGLAPSVSVVTGSVDAEIKRVGTKITNIQGMID